MYEDVEATIARYADDATVVDELHAVPPYRVYEVRLDGRRAVLKVDAHWRGHAAAEGRVQAFVAGETSASTPAVLAVGTDHFLAAYHDRIACTPDAPTDEWARSAGRWLARLHADTVGAFGGYGRPVAGDDGLEVDARDEWVDAVRARLAHHREYLEPIGYADVAAAVDAFLADSPEVFDGVDEPVLCHGNVHPEHLATGGDDGPVAIDFEHALVAPAEYDFWRVAVPLFGGHERGVDPFEQAFREGYERVGSLPADLERRRPAYELLNSVAYLESLHLQENVGPAERERIAERIRGRVSTVLAELRGELD